MWLIRIMQEFHCQGDIEKRESTKVSLFMNREKDEIQQCQSGFIKFIVLPLFDLLKLVKPSTTELYEIHLMSNLRFWNLKASKLDEELGI